MMNAKELRERYEKAQAQRTAEKRAKVEQFCNEVVEPALLRAVEDGYTQHTFLKEDCKGVDFGMLTSTLEGLGFMVIVREERLTVKFGAWGK